MNNKKIRELEKIIMVALKEHFKNHFINELGKRVSNMTVKISKQHDTTTRKNPNNTVILRIKKSEIKNTQKKEGQNE